MCQVGLLYDEVSLHNVLDMIGDWSTEDRQYLRNQVTKNNKIKKLRFMFFSFYLLF